MKRTRSVAVVGLVGVAVLMGCPAPNDEDINQLKKDVEDLKQEKQMLRDYLGKGGPLNIYLINLAEAVCELEKRTPGIPDDTRICPKDPPHDIKPPPTYPK
jgi:hypothetical protein